MSNADSLEGVAGPHSSEKALVHLPLEVPDLSEHISNEHVDFAIPVPVQGKGLGCRPTSIPWKWAAGPLSPEQARACLPLEVPDLYV
jgi:hypothetical protein